MVEGVDLRKLQIGDRVYVEGWLPFGQLGTVWYIDLPNLYNDWVSPVQVELDFPYDPPHAQRMACFALREVKYIYGSEAEYKEQEEKNRSIYWSTE